MATMKWTRDGEVGDRDAQGFWTSEDKRFRIEPLYIGRTTPQMYKVTDTQQKKSRTVPTVRAAKEEAETMKRNTPRGVSVNPVTGEVAPAGQSWVHNARFGGYQLEADGTHYCCSVSSESYWCN